MPWLFPSELSALRCQVKSLNEDAMYMKGILEFWKHEMGFFADAYVALHNYVVL